MGTTHTDTIRDLTETRDSALREVKRLAALLRSTADDSPFLARIEDALCGAMDAHHEAENALRLAERGYEETHPHPAGGVHPTDAYSRVLRGR